MCAAGDVGSGKTIVAVMAILKAIEAGKQVVLLAPTGASCFGPMLSAFVYSYYCFALLLIYRNSRKAALHYYSGLLGCTENEGERQ